MKPFIVRRRAPPRCFMNLAHASGHAGRLEIATLPARSDRKSTQRKSSEPNFTSYAVGSILGLPCDIPNHASYLQSWIDVLKKDRREIFHAAAEAQRIADYILDFHPDHATQPSEAVEDEDEARLNPALAA